jgi:hypothetical protein
VGFVVDKVALGQVFSEYFGFPCHSYSTDCSTFIIYQPVAGRIGQLAADVPSGLSLNPHQETKINKKAISLINS